MLMRNEALLRPPVAGARFLGKEEIIEDGDVILLWDPAAEDLVWKPIHRRMTGRRCLHRRVYRVIVRLVHSADGGTSTG